MHSPMYVIIYIRDARFDDKTQTILWYYYLNRRIRKRKVNGENTLVFPAYDNIKIHTWCLPCRTYMYIFYYSVNFPRASTTTVTRRAECLRGNDNNILYRYTHPDRSCTLHNNGRFQRRNFVIDNVSYIYLYQWRATVVVESVGWASKKSYTST